MTLKVFLRSTQDVDIWIEIPVQHDVYIELLIIPLQII